MRRIFLLAFLSLGAGPSPVVYPTQKLPLSFSHADHLKRGMGCVPCHEQAPRSLHAADLLTPPEAACTGCHAIDRARPDARCGSCHPGWNGAGEPARIVIPPPNLKFNHQVHAQRNIQCETCHGDIRDQGLATRNDLPRMSLCLGCHDGQKAQAACTTCHPGNAKGMVLTDLPDGTLAPSDHDLRFRTDHARAAQQDARSCQSCHEQRWCLDCHNGVAKPFDFHGNDYLRLHPVDARRNNMSCQGCHRLQTFCTGCHARSGVSDDPRTGEFQRPSQTENPTNRFHPSGWFTTFDRDMRQGTHHGFQAQRNIRACASCHRESFCMDCHAQAVSPHPPGFAATARCRALSSRAGRTCLRCHTRVEDARCE